MILKTWTTSFPRNEAAVDGGESGGGTGGGESDTAAAVAAAAAATEDKTTDETGAAIEKAVTGQDGSWRDGLPEEMRGEEALKNFNDIGGLAKAFVDTKRMQGNSIHIPGEDAGDEDRKAFVDKLIERVPELMLKPDFEKDEQSADFWRALGMPESPEGYEIPQPELQEGEESNIDEDRINIAKNAAHKLGISNKQLNGVLKAVMDYDVETARNADRSQSEELHGLHKEWGLAFEQKYAAALQVAKATGAPPVLVDAIKGGQAGPETLKWLYQMGKNMGGEGNNLLTMGDGVDTKMTPSEAQEKIDEIMNNKEHPYWVASHPNHQKALDQMVELHDYKAGRR